MKKPLSKPVEEFGLFVTSNKSNSHILFGDTNRTPCGLVHKLVDTNHPNSEVRWYLPKSEFSEWIKQARHSSEKGYRLCKHCLKAFDILNNCVS